jgi:subtilase family serine protease
MYSAKFGLPHATIANGMLVVVNQTGGSTLPPPAPADDPYVLLFFCFLCLLSYLNFAILFSWCEETTLDVEAVHAIAPGAKILVVLAHDDISNGLLIAANYAGLHAGILSTPL